MRVIATARSDAACLPTKITRAVERSVLSSRRGADAGGSPLGSGLAWLLAGTYPVGDGWEIMMSPVQRPENRGTGMRVRALTLIVLVAAWMVPTGGSSCPSTVQGLANHTHVHSSDPASDSHDHAVPGHSHAHAAEVAAQSGATRDSASDDPTCCKRASDARAMQAALQDAQPRTKLSIATLPTLRTVAPLAPTSVSGPALRRQPPPPRPYAYTRRPLLI